MIRGKRIVWHGKEFISNLDKGLQTNVAKALVFLTKQVQENVNIPTELHGPSAPGEYPHKVRGDLQRSIFPRGPRTKHTRVEGDVGTALSYAIYHEITDRSFLRRTFKEMQPWIARILCEPVTKPGRKGFRYSAAEIAKVRQMAAEGISVARIAEQTGISRSHVRGVITGKTRIKR